MGDSLRATARDVAEAAGVSVKTVSRVLNNERYVGQDTREKVQAAVAALGFRPQAATRAASARRGGPVALLFREGAPEAAGVLAGVEARCAAAGVPVVAVALDGAVLLGTVADDGAIRAALAERGVRTVPVSPASGAAPAVGLHDAPAAAVMTGHLLALGHRRIGFVGAGDAAGAERARGHRAALAAAGIADDPALVVEAAHDFAGGSRAGAALQELAEPPTAIFAASDTLAAGVLTAMHARGLRVPEDVSVAGFGDEPLAAYVWPPLTTIRVSARAMGEQAADLLLSGADERRDVPFELVERASAVGTGI